MGVLRHTPAGIPVLQFRLNHRSRQTEAGLPRDVTVEVAGVALGPQARLLAGAALGSSVRVGGFLAERSARSTQPVIHVNEIEFLEQDNVQR
ncbi:MAG: primosomal replication protein N [Betaproteobacteria bacterium]|nr:primosomal replication protein N [Betaproteobacteria bacterium]